MMPRTVTNRSKRFRLLCQYPKGPRAHDFMIALKRNKTLCESDLIAQVVHGKLTSVRKRSVNMADTVAKGLVKKPSTFHCNKVTSEELILVNSSN